MIKIAKFDFKLPRCPYCNSRLWYSEIFVFKNKNDINCPCCGNKSEIILKTEIFQVLGFIESLCLIIFALCVFKGGGYCLLGLLIVLLIFTGFYIFSPFCVKLKFTNLIIQDSRPVKNSENTENITDKDIFSN